MPKKLRKSIECLNCHRMIIDFNYCPHCGQQNTDKQVPVRLLFRDMVDELFSMDSRLFRSLATLISKPGHLTNEYNNGRRQRYVAPLRLYLIVTIVYFGLISMQSTLEENSRSINTMIATPDTTNYRVVYENLFRPFRARIGDIETERLMTRLNAIYQIRKPLRVDTLRSRIQSIYPLPYLTAAEIAHKLAVTFNIKPSLNPEHDRPTSEVTEIVGEFVKDVAVRDKIVDGLLETVRFRKLYYSPYKQNHNDIRYQHLAGIEQISESFRDSVYFHMVTHYRFPKRSQPEFVVMGDKMVNVFEVDTANPSMVGRFWMHFDRKAEQLNLMSPTAFWGLVIDQIPTVFFILMPIFALILKLLYIRRTIFYANHFIFALHIHTIIFLILMSFLLFDASWFIFVMILVSWAYTFKAMLTVYGQSAIKTLVKMSLLFGIYFFALVFGFVLDLVLVILSS